MFQRSLLKYLEEWRQSPQRKPLIIRGARQTGKTTLIQLFSKTFERIVYLNLELTYERRFWMENPSLEILIRNIEVAKNLKIQPKTTLLFIDEIQNEPKAIHSLRYFYEQMPDLHVIATGSLMEVALKEKGFSFPVGRVSFLYLYPLCFNEFLSAMSHEALLQELDAVRHNTKLSSAIHAFALEKFQEYIYVGGMPEVVRAYLEEKSYTPLKSIKESLLTSFEEDVHKYASRAQTSHIQFLIRNAPLFAGQRIQYANFGNSQFRSREMRFAFEMLEQAMVVQRIPGNFQTVPPIHCNFRVSPKLLFLDVGLVAHRLSIEPTSLQGGDLNDLFRGTFAEQIVGQELLALDFLKREPPAFWYRNQAGSSAEVDFCLQVKGKVIPIEVKSGKAGRLRSLLQFMEQSPHPYAVRVYSGPVKQDTLITPKNKTFKLLSIPFYLTYNLKNILRDWVD